jgi:23S rRNA pseudouridine1911/1915/1917 synthase
MERQALHAGRLAFRQPSSQALLSFHCPPPSDFAHAWAEIGADADA